MNASRTALLFSLAIGLSAQTNNVGTEPSPMEAFIKQPGAHTIWSGKAAVLENEGTRAVITPMVALNGSKRMRGVMVELSSNTGHDVVYLDEEATRRTRDALDEISNALLRRAVNGCMGAREFWPLYDWAWNSYHELNAEQCATPRDPTLVFSGRGRPQRYTFTGETAGGASAIFTAAMNQYANQ